MSAIIRPITLVASALAAVFSLAPDVSACSPGPGTRPHGVDYIVRFRDPDGDRHALGPKAPLGRMAEAARSLGVEFQPLHRMATGDQVVRLTGRDARFARDAARRLAARADVEFIVEDTRMHAFWTPNDPLYPNQWALNGTHGIRAPLAWESSLGSGTVIAVLDTGYTNHPDLAGKITAGYDFISSPTVAKDGDGRDPNPIDPGDAHTEGCLTKPSSWHGTQVAGLAAAATNNTTGIAGAAPNAMIMPVRVLGAGGGSLSDIADAIRWAAGGTVPGVPTLAASAVADVINLSLGASGACDVVMQEAINFANSRGVVVVAAAGNSGVNAAQATPASCNGVITVAASTSAGARAGYSNHTSVELAAPGHLVRTTSNSGVGGPGAYIYSDMQGTSAAAPHVAGVAALMQARSPRSPAEVANVLVQTARPAGACAGCGAGILDASAALAAVAPNRPPVADFQITFTCSAGKPSVSATMVNLSSDPDGDAMSAYWDFGTGVTSTEWSPTAKVPDGSTVTLTITDVHGGVSTSSQYHFARCLQ